MTFGEKLQALRKKQGLSQEQLAEALDVSRQAISKWELNTAMPDAGNIVKLSDLLGVTTDYLMKDTADAQDEIAKLEEQILQMKKELQELSADKKKGVSGKLVSAITVTLVGVAGIVLLFAVYLSSGTYYAAMPFGNFDGFIAFLICENIVLLFLGLCAICAVGVWMWMYVIANDL